VLEITDNSSSCRITKLLGLVTAEESGSTVDGPAIGVLVTIVAGLDGVRLVKDSVNLGLFRRASLDRSVVRGSSVDGNSSDGNSHEEDSRKLHFE
jgi:hypothetical protein